MPFFWYAGEGGEEWSSRCGRNCKGLQADRSREAAPLFWFKDLGGGGGGVRRGSVRLCFLPSDLKGETKLHSRSHVPGRVAGGRRGARGVWVMGVREVVGDGTPLPENSLW